MATGAVYRRVSADDFTDQTAAIHVNRIFDEPRDPGAASLYIAVAGAGGFDAIARMDLTGRTQPSQMASPKV